MIGKYKYILLTLLGGHLVLLGLLAIFGIIGGDEGFYCNAARTVGLGQQLYTDFFYTQMPLMPTIFSSLALSGWSSLFVLRGFVVAAGFLSALLLFLITLKLTSSIRAALICLGMYVFSGIILQMHYVFEPLVFAHFLSLATFLFWLKYRESEKSSYLIGTALLLSLVINHRATFVILLPLYIISIMVWHKEGTIKRLGLFIVGLIPPAIPTLIHIIKSPHHFFFDTFMFQLYRDPDKSPGAFLSNKLSVLMRTVIDPHLLIIIILTIISMVLLVRRKQIASFRDMVIKPEGMAVANLILIAAIYLVPHPTLRHYFEQFAGFAIIVIGMNLDYILERLRLMIGAAKQKTLIISISALYILSLIPYIVNGIWGVRSSDHMRRQSEVRKITGKMLELAGPADTVFSEWPLYPFLTKQQTLPYTEIIGSHWAFPIEHEQYMKYKLCDSTYLRNAVTMKIPKLVVVLYKTMQYYADPLRDGYDLAYQSGAVSIYKRK
jgi:4-amino-4-deoxy-L-arabinose transferase-like glycosyltransferase